MAHAPRILLPGGVYHVYTRGVRRDRIFLDDRDRHRFLRYLGLVCAGFGIEARSYCLMDNHLHSHICTPLPNLSDAMQQLFSAYARYFNARHEGTGHVFESRFKSPLVEPGEFETGLSRYVHLNPVAAKMVQRPDEYEWSSYRAYVGLEESPRWLRTEPVLAQFGQDTRNRITKYRLFVEGEGGDGAQTFEKDLVIGGDEFRALHDPSESSEILVARPCPDAGITIARVLEAVAVEFGTEVWTMGLRGQEPSLAKRAAAFILKSLGMWPQETLAAHLRLSARTVSRYVRDTRLQARRDEGLRDKLRRCLRRLHGEDAGS